MLKLVLAAMVSIASMIGSARAATISLSGIADPQFVGPGEVAATSVGNFTYDPNNSTLIIFGPQGYHTTRALTGSITFSGLSSFDGFVAGASTTFDATQMTLNLVYDSTWTLFGVDSNNTLNADGYGLYGLGGNGLDSLTTRYGNNQFGGAYFTNSASALDVPEPSMALIILAGVVSTVAMAQWGRDKAVPCPASDPAIAGQHPQAV